jgi:hypothetical protein
MTHIRLVGIFIRMPNKGIKGCFGATIIKERCLIHFSLRSYIFVVFAKIIFS